CGGGLHMLDLSTPTVPDFAGCFADPTTGRSLTGYSHDVQCVVYHGPDIEHQGKEVCISSNETHVVIADVTDKNNPATIGKGTYPTARYIHQGWLTEDHRFFLQDDELDELGVNATVVNTTTYVWDVEDLDDPVQVDTFMNTIGVIDHNQFVLGRYSVQANYAAGMRVIDFGDVENAYELLYFDTYPAANSEIFNGAWGVYPYLPSGLILVTSMGQGFFVLQPSIPLRLALDLRVFLEGPYVGSDLMSTGALFDAALPASQPYVEPEFNGTSLDHDLPETVLSLPEDVVDWVLVELRAEATDAAPITTEPGILLQDGRVVAATGDTLRFDGALPGSYWVVVRHRNHLAVMSSSTVDLSLGSGAWDFTDSAAKGYGSNPMKALADGRFGMFASDGSIDGQVTAPDFNLWNAATTAGTTGYEPADFNLDGQVTAPDFNLWNANTTAGATSKVPD
ncbi:MAG TPA: choice-of-anchor B family protein, partial [Rhodothermia bacterium]|nr:choice-of-anchor B family protein [Rhodothermia bacterium]